MEHTRKILGGHIGVLFYDVTALYFESDYEDELRKTGFSKEGRHKKTQIILGLLVSLGGYPLAYSIHEGNKYEGHTMLPVVIEFVRKYKLEDFIIMADSGLMNNDNIADLDDNALILFFQAGEEPIKSTKALPDRSWRPGLTTQNPKSE